MVRIPSNAHVLNSDVEYTKITRKLYVYSSFDAAGLLLALIMCFAHADCLLEQCAFEYIFAFYILCILFNLSSLIINVWTLHTIRKRYIKIWLPLMSLILDTFLFALSIASLVASIHMENYDHINDHPEDRHDHQCACASANVIVIPILLLSLIQVLRSLHVFALVMYLLFVFPFTCLPDDSCLKPSCVKKTGAGRLILSKIGSVRWKMSEKEYEVV